MSFYARDFIFGGTMSQSLGLTISSDGAESETSASSDVEIIREKIYRRPDLYILGVDQSPVLSFPISLNSESKIDAVRAALIEKTLFGQMDYKKLQVIAPDYNDVYWDCHLKSPTIKRVGGEIVGYNALVECRSPWAKTFPKNLYLPSKNDNFTTFPINYPPGSSYYLYNNTSGNNDYTYPKIIITTSGSASAGYLTIINKTENNRVFQIANPPSNDVITIDNDLQIISSVSGLVTLAMFNKKWFRWLPGKNEIKLSGQIKKIQFITTEARKIGG